MLKKGADQPSCLDFFSKAKKDCNLGLANLAVHEKSLIISEYAQSDPFIGKNEYQFNQKPIQPILVSYPVTKRRFVKKWYSEFMWLEFSVSQDKSFCHPCRVFGKETGNNEQSFISIGFNDWIHAKAAFKTHEATDCHKIATEFLENRQNQDKNKTSVNKQLEKVREKQIDKNRNYLLKIIQTVLFCAKQNIALRGHNESPESLNRGNFLELLELRKQDVEVLNEKFAFSYCSPETQNQILEIIASEVTRIIVAECKNRPFSIIVDETPDISNHEQVSICIRYVDHKLQIIERFVRFCKVESTTGDLLESLISSVLKELGLSAENFLVGQSYDGGSNMCGENKGVASRIRKKIPRAIYVHCRAHKLNLAIGDSLNQLESARNCLGTLNSLYNFIECSPKRHALFINSQLSSKTTTVKRVDGTRWSSRQRALSSLIDTYEFVLETLSYIDLTDKSQSGTIARSLLRAIEDFEFQFMARLLNLIFSRIRIFSDALQSPTIEMDRCSRLLENTIDSLTELSNDSLFDNLYRECINFAKDHSMDQPILPRNIRVPDKLKDSIKQNKSFSSAEERFKSIYYETLEKVINDLRNRFTDETLAPLILIECILKTEHKETDLEKLVELDFYNDLVNFDLLKNEIVLWTHDLKKRKKMKENDLITISYITKLFRDEKLGLDYPNLEMLLIIYLTAPITSVTAERSFSALKRIKTYIRNTTGQNRLNSLALIHIEKEIIEDIDLENLVDIFGSILNRRMLFY